MGMGYVMLCYGAGLVEGKDVGGLCLRGMDIGGGY